MITRQLGTSVVQLRRSARAAFSWWIGELMEVIPQKFLANFRGRQRMATVTVTPGDLSLDWANGPDVSKVENALERNFGNDFDKLFRVLTNAMRGAAASIRVRLQEDVVLRRRIVLPMAAQKRLQEIIELDVERQTPFSLNDIYLACRVCRLIGNDRIEAEFVAIERAIVDPLVNGAEASRFTVSEIEIIGDDGFIWPVNDILRTRKVQRKKNYGRIATATLFAVIIGLIAEFVNITLDQQRTRAEKIEGEALKARQQAKAVSDLEKDVVRAFGVASFLPRKKQAPSISDQLEGLARTLPDDTWLFEVQLGADGRIVGYSRAASRLIGQIEESKVFRAPRFRSPVTQEARGNVERFEIGFEIQKAPGR